MAPYASAGAASRVKWAEKKTYKDIAEQFVNYVRTKFGHSCVVFDGYEQGPSIKDHEHQRRVKKTCRYSPQ